MQIKYNMWSMNDRWILLKAVSNMDLADQLTAKWLWSCHLFLHIKDECLLFSIIKCVETRQLVIRWTVYSNYSWRHADIDISPGSLGEICGENTNSMHLDGLHQPVIDNGMEINFKWHILLVCVESTVRCIYVSCGTETTKIWNVGRVGQSIIRN